GINAGGASPRIPFLRLIALPTRRGSTLAMEARKLEITLSLNAIGFGQSLQIARQIAGVAKREHFNRVPLCAARPPGRRPRCQHASPRTWREPRRRPLRLPPSHGLLDRAPRSAWTRGPSERHAVRQLPRHRRFANPRVTTAPPG